MAPGSKKIVKIVIGLVLLFIVLIISGIWFLYIHYNLRGSGDVQRPVGESLKTLPYVVWSTIEKRDMGKSGVIKYNRELSYEGIHIFHSENMVGGQLLDMSGNVLHQLHDKRGEDVSEKTWRLIEPCINDEFIILIESHSLMRIDWESNIKWVKKNRFHHDVAIDDNGDIYAVINKKRDFPLYSSAEAIMDNVILILTSEGEIKKEISFAEVFPHDSVLLEAARNQENKVHISKRNIWDIFHTNSLELIERDVFYTDSSGAAQKLFKKGDLLFCMRHTNIIGVMDIEKERVTWSWGLGELDYPHHPTLLENGNILIFDNGFQRQYSRVIEINPLSEAIEWEYSADRPKSFYSSSRGSSQRLANGNTIIVESNKGHVFEITRDGTIVWDFYNPKVKENKRAAIYRMRRVFESEKYPWIKRLSE